MRHISAVMLLGGKVYAIGGCSGSDLNTAEVYDPGTNTWSPIASMGAQRSGVAAVSLGGKVYAIGGYSGSELNTAV